MTKHRIVLCAVLAFAAFSVAACGGTSRERLVIATPDEPFPHATLSDIVSYADQLSIVRVIDDRPGRMTPEEVAAGEGYLPRFGTVVIERTLWSRKAAPPPPSDAYELQLQGWAMQQGGKQIKMVDGPGPWMEPGERYLIVLVNYQGELTWYAADLAWPVASAATDAVAGDVTFVRSPLLVGEQLVGRTAEEIAQQIALSHPDPIAEQYASLPLEERYAQVVAAGPDRVGEIGEGEIPSPG